jgi:SAM-dependent methyltransferase
MGTAAVQGELWGARARDRAEADEPRWRATYEAVLWRAGVGRGTRLLDVGCGGGTALMLAREVGAEVSGLDGSEALVAIARERLPGARLEVGEMEDLPFMDASFDVVTSFNSFQFAGDTVQALRQARRVCKDGGAVAWLFWGPREVCDIIGGVAGALMPFLAPPGAAPPPPPTPYHEPGMVEGLMERAGLRPERRGEVDVAFFYPDAETAWRCVGSAGITVKAMRQAGEAAVKDALRATFTRYARPDGSVVMRNVFHWVLARR